MSTRTRLLNECHDRLDDPVSHNDNIRTDSDALNHKRHARLIVDMNVRVRMKGKGGDEAALNSTKPFAVVDMNSLSETIARLFPELRAETWNEVSLLLAFSDYLPWILVIPESNKATTLAEYVTALIS